jgi:hypothetical protein
VGGARACAANGTTGSATVPERDPDQNLDALQPDFTLSSLPTTLRLPRYRFDFRVTHRFGRPLNQGDFGDLLADFFALDSSAQIGLELRFGFMRGTQGGIYRTNDRTIEFFVEHNLTAAVRYALPSDSVPWRRLMEPTTSRTAIHQCLAPLSRER